MELPDFTVEHLKQLPLRAIVAFAARCAGRVEPLAQLPEGAPGAGGPSGRHRGRPPDGRGLREGRGRGPRQSVVEAIDASRGRRRRPARQPDAAAAAAGAAHAAASAWHAHRPREAEQERAARR